MTHVAEVEVNRALIKETDPLLEEMGKRRKKVPKAIITAKLIAISRTGVTSLIFSENRFWTGAIVTSPSAARTYERRKYLIKILGYSLK